MALLAEVALAGESWKLAKPVAEPGDLGRARA